MTFFDFTRKSLKHIKETLKIKNFWLKMFGMVLNTAIYTRWRQWEGACGMLGQGQIMLFLFTVPPSNVIFTAEMMVMFLGERPDMWFHRVYNSVGGILYGTVGVVALFNRSHHLEMGTNPLIIAVVCFIQSFVLIVDMLMNEARLINKRLPPPVPVFEEYD